MTMEQLYRQESERLAQAGVGDALIDGRYLLLEAFGLNMATFLAVRNQELCEDEDTKEKRRRYEALIRKRAMRIPLQQLTGVQGFMGQIFYVNDHVLIPRQDTETLVELVLKEQPLRQSSLLDICTGSGCIAISLAHLGGYKQITALDISGEALKVARKNGEALLGDYEGCLQFVESDMFEKLAQRPGFDIITSNPPYIRSQVIEDLEPEVRRYEPRLALDGAEDGLKFYRILADKCRSYLNPGGCVYMEIGCDQGPEVEELFRDRGYEEIRTVQDMAGLDRVVRARWNEPQQEVYHV